MATADIGNVSPQILEAKMENKHTRIIFYNSTSDNLGLSEVDIKLNFITPSLSAKGWQGKITMETKVFFTDGKINSGERQKAG